jgi:hypothetical protein
MKTAICFIHDRADWYLNYAINQALSSSPGVETVLLGSPAVIIEGCATIDIEKYKKTKGAQDFLAVYKHMSPMSYTYESFCFLRWFYVLEYMRESGIELVLYLDSDSLLFSSIEEILDWAGNQAGCGYLIPEQDYESNYWVGSGNTALWTRGMLQRFCDFILRSYTEEKYLEAYEKKWRSGAGGGICDMTALYLFWLENGEEICNLAITRMGMVCDLNINSSANFRDNEFRKKMGIKKLSDYKGKPAFMSQSGEEKVRVHVAHFQGRAKSFMPKYYNGGYFLGKAKRDFLSFFSIARQLLHRGHEKVSIIIRHLMRKDE